MKEFLINNWENILVIVLSMAIALYSLRDVLPLGKKVFSDGKNKSKNILEKIKKKNNS